MNTNKRNQIHKKTYIWSVIFIYLCAVGFLIGGTITVIPIQKSEPIEASGIVQSVDIISDSKQFKFNITINNTAYIGWGSSAYNRVKIKSIKQGDIAEYSYEKDTTTLRGLTINNEVICTAEKSYKVECTADLTMGILLLLLGGAFIFIGTLVLVQNIKNKNYI